MCRYNGQRDPSLISLAGVPPEVKPMASCTGPHTWALPATAALAPHPVRPAGSQPGAGPVRLDVTLSQEPASRKCRKQSTVQAVGQPSGEKIKWFKNEKTKHHKNRQCCQSTVIPTHVPSTEAYGLCRAAVPQTSMTDLPSFTNFLEAQIL